MALPPGYRLRSATPGDLEPAAAVLAADDLDDAGQVVLDAGFLREQWARPGFDLAADAWVASGDRGTVVAYGQALREEPDIVGSWGVVHPAYRGRGIGSSLLDRIEERAAELLAGVPSPRFRHAVNAGDDAAAALLRHRGLRLVRHFWHMRIELPPEVEPRAAPKGIEIKGLRPERDFAAVHRVLDEAFLDHWDYRSAPFERWVAEETASPGYDPGLWLLAWSGDTLVGALTAVTMGERAWIGLLGVLAPFRGRGVAATLLRHSFAVFAARGLRVVTLAVDAANPTGATVLYERVGMGVVKRWDLWERPFTP